MGKVGTFKENTGRSITEAFELFHAANPDVYVLIKKEALKAVRAGKTKFSVKAIINWIRWEVRKNTIELTLFNSKEGPKKFKINDAYSSRYSRLLINEFPEMEKYVELRDLRSF